MTHRAKVNGVEYVVECTEAQMPGYTTALVRAVWRGFSGAQQHLLPVRISADDFMLHDPLWALMRREAFEDLLKNIRGEITEEEVSNLALQHPDRRGV